jgi:hypothetical protein
VRRASSGSRAGSISHANELAIDVGDSCAAGDALDSSAENEPDADSEAARGDDMDCGGRHQNSRTANIGGATKKCSDNIFTFSFETK